VPAVAGGLVARGGRAGEEPQARAAPRRAHLTAQAELRAAGGLVDLAGELGTEELGLGRRRPAGGKLHLEAGVAGCIKLERVAWAVRLAEGDQAGGGGHAEVDHRLGLQHDFGGEAHRLARGGEQHRRGAGHRGFAQPGMHDELEVLRGGDAVGEHRTQIEETFGRSRNLAHGPGAQAGPGDVDDFAVAAEAEGEDLGFALHDVQFQAQLAGDLGRAEAYGLLGVGGEEQRDGRRHALHVDDDAPAFRGERGGGLGGVSLFRRGDERAGEGEQGGDE
jgi:hypothetical protein